MANAFQLRTNTPFTKNTRLRGNNPFTVNSERLLASEDNMTLNPRFRRATDSLNDIFTYYSEGNFEALARELTPERYSQLSLELIKLKNRFNVDYERIRLTAVKSLKGIQRANVQYKSLNDVLRHNEILAEKADILDDRDKLAAYINTLNNTRRTSIFGDHNISSSVSATIAPEYLAYIRDFGYPQDGVFDPDLLGKYANMV